MSIRICLSISAMDDEFNSLSNTLRNYAEVDVVGLDGFSLKGYDIFIGKKLKPEILNTADRLKMAFAYKTGVDDFPLEMLAEKGIGLVNSHADADYIAEYAMGLSISLVNRITEFDKKLRRGIWHDQKNPYWRSLFSIKIGLLGYGCIGKEIHKLLSRNNIVTYTIDRGHSYDSEEAPIKLVSSLEELCKETDLIIISLPKTPQTNGLFNKEIFKLMQNKYLVNVGRSNCIDQKALYEALKSEYMAGAAIDTWDEKPKNIHEIFLPSKYPLSELENIVLSPHQAMRVMDGHAKYVNDIQEKVIDYISGRPLRDMVDLKRGY